MRKFLYLFLAILSLPLLFSSCKKDIANNESSSRDVAYYNSQVVREWNDLFVEIERFAEGYRPCPTANALGYVGLANYEALVTGMPEYKSLANLYGLNLPRTLNDQPYHWPTVSNAVNNYLYTRLFPSVRPNLFARIKLLNDKFENSYQAEVGADEFSRSRNHGIAVAEAVWKFMETDPYTFNKYVDPFEDYNWEENKVKDGDWVATFPGPNRGMFPYWGNGRTLAIREDMKLCRPMSTYARYSEDPKSAFYAQAIEVLAQNTPTLSFQAQWVGEFWSDDLINVTFSPPARFLAIANQVYVNEKSNLETAIIANAKLGIALHDAAIGCWNSKYHYNLERPESYIKRVIDIAWEPNLNNPNTGERGISPSFPAYPSGHATFGAAACEALADVFGYNYAMTDNCHKNRTDFIGFPRSFNSFYEMANENAWSRIPLGVHYRMDAEEGMHYGTQIGRAVNNLPWKK